MVMIYDDDDFSDKDLNLNSAQSPTSSIRPTRFKKQFSSQSQIGRAESLENSSPIREEEEIIKMDNGKLGFSQVVQQQQHGVTHVTNTSKVRKKIGNAVSEAKLNNGNVIKKPNHQQAYSLNQSTGPQNELGSPIKSQTQKMQLEQNLNAPMQNNLMYMPNSPYAKNLIMNQLPQGKPRLASAARASSSQGYHTTSNGGLRSRRSLLPAGIQKQQRNINGFREIKSRASRFNLSSDEQTIYQNFAGILSTFDEETMNDLLDCLLKDAKDMQFQNMSQQQLQL